MYISEIVTTPPENISERVPLEQEVYKVFKKLGIPFERVDNDPASSMEECSDMSHMSFASPEHMWEHLGTKPGSASVVGLLNDEDDYVQLIIDKEVAEAEYFVCNTGINTTHLKFKTQDLLKKFLPYTHHRPRIVDL